MSVILRAVEQRVAAGGPIRVGLVGAGFAGRGFAVQVLTANTGLRLVAVANRTPGQAERAYGNAGVTDVQRVSTAAELDLAIAAGRPVVTDDPSVITDAAGVEAVVEATGDVEAGARTALRAIEHGKHVVLINAELDSTLGPILKHHADRAGVIVTDMSGDQPGVLMDLVTEVDQLGFRPVLAGNMKGLLDHRRTPETQRGFAEATLQRPRMVTSFADGTKLSAEMAVVANATGFGVSVRGMLGPRASRVEEATNLFDLEALLERPVVDYLLGAEPSVGVFVIGHREQAVANHLMRLYKLGDGPFFTFYRPFHLGPLEAPIAVARAVLFDDAVIAPLGAPVCEVVTIAKRDLRAGETLDGIGGFTAFGDIENSGTARHGDLLPIGLADGARLRADVAMDTAIRFADVDLPAGRLSERMWREQLALFAGQDAPAL